MSNFKYNNSFISLIQKVKTLKGNKAFYKQQDKLYGHLLTINGYPLDKIQKKVVFSDNKYTMVVAAAGSGKTTTMIGKIKYLIYAKNIQPKDILVISFTNESVNSFKQALFNNQVSNVNVLTFHKLALLFLKDISIIDSGYLQTIIKEYLYSNYYTDKAFIITKAFKNSNYSDLIDNIDKYIKILTKIINLCHTNNYSLEDFMKTRNKILKKAFWKRATLLSMLYIIMDIYYLYEEEKKATRLMDFDDLIIKATNNIKDYKLNYKYIIVDEYQDTSLIRVNFLKQIINYANAKLLVVGDDYQSIYRFNGCDINIFLNFKKYFSNAKIIKLQNTYRNSQELINITKSFILKNPYQINKKIKSNKRLKNPIKIVYYNEHTKQYKLKALLNYINNNYGNYLILGRNNFDIINLKQDLSKFLTVHKSKGLEAENIVLINLENNLYGFPNQIKNLEIENILFKNDCMFPYDEERRLFYVALTRSKNYVFLFVNKKNSSTFVEELIKNYVIEILKI